MQKLITEDYEAKEKRKKEDKDRQRQRYRWLSKEWKDKLIDKASLIYYSKIGLHT